MISWLFMFETSFITIVLSDFFCSSFLVMYFAFSANCRRRTVDRSIAINEQDMFRCLSCSKVYKLLSSLRRHEKFECGTGPLFSCPICQQRLKQKSYIQLHIKKCHPDKSNNILFWKKWCFYFCNNICYIKVFVQIYYFQPDFGNNGWSISGNHVGRLTSLTNYLILWHHKLLVILSSGAQHKTGNTLNSPSVHVIVTQLFVIFSTYEYYLKPSTLYGPRMEVSIGSLLEENNILHSVINYKNH